MKENLTILTIQDLIKNHIKYIQNEGTSKILKSNPNFPKTVQLRNKEAIERHVSEIEKIHNSLIPFVKKIKTKYIQDITQKNLNCALYLLICHILKTWEAIFLLAKNNFNNEMLDLIRHVYETVGLITLFTNKEDLLKKWFAGEIIPHRKSRKALENLINSKTIDIYNAQNFQYELLSQYTHSSYSVMLELVDVFTKDFDFNNFSGSHFTKENLTYLDTIMTSTIIALKTIFTHLNDLTTLQEINTLFEERLYKKKKNPANLGNMFPKKNINGRK